MKKQCGCNSNKEENLNEHLGTIYNENQSDKMLLENFTFKKKEVIVDDDNFVDNLIPDWILEKLDGKEPYAERVLAEKVLDRDDKLLYTPDQIRAWVKYGLENGLVDNRSKNAIQDWVKLLRTSVVDLTDLVDKYGND